MLVMVILVIVVTVVENTGINNAYYASNIVQNAIPISSFYR